MICLRHQNSQSISYYGTANFCRFWLQLSYILFYVKIIDVCFKKSMKTDFYLAEINRGDVKDTEIEATMDSIVDSLFSVFVTLGKPRHELI